KLPSGCDSVHRSILNPAKWQIVNVAEDKSMRDVKVRHRTLSAKVSSVLGKGSAGVAGCGDTDAIVDRFRPGIRTDEAEALTHAPLSTHCHTVEVRVADRRDVAASDVPIRGKRAPACHRAWPRKRLVDIPLYGQFVSL